MVIGVVVVPGDFVSFGMERGGRFLTRVFDGYNRLTGAGAGLLAFGAGLRVWLGEPWPSAVECVLLVAVIGLALFITLVLAPASVRLQEHAFAAQGDEAKRAAYADFFAMHHTGRALYVVDWAAALALLGLKAKPRVAP